MGETGRMIDLHNHILYGRDDGPETIEESIRMCRTAYEDGIRAIVATPHILPGIYENDRSVILSKVAELNTALVRSATFTLSSSGVAGAKDGRNNASHLVNDSMTQLPKNSSPLSDPITRFLKDAASQRVPFSSDSNSTIDNQQSPIKILPGADVHFSSDLLERLERKEIVTVNDGGRFLMVEFAFEGVPFQAENVLFKLIMNGITPIISHPERNMEIEQRPHRYYAMIRMGCLGQITAMSLTGEFGPETKRNAERLLSKRLIHIIASDAHSSGRRPPILSSGVRAAEKIVGKEEAQKMVTEYPEAVINGLRPNVPEPLSP